MLSGLSLYVLLDEVNEHCLLQHTRDTVRRPAEFEMITQTTDHTIFVSWM
jgi:hypothetical protein